MLQAHCWFLSCIVPYWLVHNAMYRRLKQMTSQGLVLMLVGIWLAVWLFIIAIPSMAGDVEWYKGHKWGATDEWKDVLVVMLKFHPLCYFHIYVFGAALAVLHTRSKVHSFLVRNGAILGFGGLYLIFFLSPWIKIPASKLSCRLGVLAPLQGLSLLGLAVGEDPLARLFAIKYFQLGELISFPQYIFQVPALPALPPFSTPPPPSSLVRFRITFYPAWKPSIYPGAFQGLLLLLYSHILPSFTVHCLHALEHRHWVRVLGTARRYQCGRLQVCPGAAAGKGKLTTKLRGKAGIYLLPFILLPAGRLAHKVRLQCCPTKRRLPSGSRSLLAARDRLSPRLYKAPGPAAGRSQGRSLHQPLPPLLHRQLD